MPQQTPLTKVEEKPKIKREMPSIPIIKKEKPSTGLFISDQLQSCPINFKYTLSKAQVDLKVKYGALPREKKQLSIQALQPDLQSTAHFAKSIDSSNFGYMPKLASSPKKISHNRFFSPQNSKMINSRVDGLSVIREYENESNLISPIKPVQNNRGSVVSHRSFFHAIKTQMSQRESTNNPPSEVTQAPKNLLNTIDDIYSQNPSQNLSSNLSPIRNNRHIESIKNLTLKKMGGVGPMHVGSPDW